MGTEYIEFALVASKDGHDVLEADFLFPLGLKPGRSEGFQCWAADGRKSSSGVAFFRLEIADYRQHEEERYTFFEADLQARLSAIAFWLSKQSDEAFARFTVEGLELVFIINALIDQDQFELSLKPDLLAELGRLKIRIYILTNE